MKKQTRFRSGFRFLLAAAWAGTAVVPGAAGAPLVTGAPVAAQARAAASPPSRVSVPATRTPARAVRAWWQDAIFYEIFVRSFQDADGDGIGDLRGITSRLDYLGSGVAGDPRPLGATALWLTPIFASPSYHGYDATDFRAVNPAYGTLDDFKTLLREAHRRGIRVVLDLAVNHTSDQHPWFLEALRDRASAAHGRYCWKSQDPGWPGPDRWHASGDEFYYAVFSKGLPDLNWKNPEVRADVLATLRYWAGLGVDGFRLDAARYYVEGPAGEPDSAETHQAIREFAGALRKDFPETMFVGEVWADSQTIAPYVADGGELDLAFNFPVAGGLGASLKAETAGNFLSALADSRRRIANPERLAAFLSNHDQVRLATQLGGNVAKLKLAAAALFTLPGTPFIYYGEEIGLPDGPDPRPAPSPSPGAPPVRPNRNDPAKRTPMEWNAEAGHGFTAGRPWQDFSANDPELNVDAQLGAPASLLAAYRALIGVRRNEPALREGSLEPLSAPQPALAAFVRRTADRAVLVVLNFGAAAVPASGFAVPWSGTVRVKTLWGDAKPSVTGAGGTSLNVQLEGLPGFSAAVILFRQGV